MKCPFCSSKLQGWTHSFHTTYACIAEECIVDGMPRYQIGYNNYPTKLSFRTFMLDKYYVQINYENKATIISILEACFLLDSLEISRVLEVDFKNMDALLTKVKMLVLFS